MYIYNIPNDNKFIDIVNDIMPRQVETFPAKFTICPLGFMDSSIFRPMTNEINAAAEEFE